MQQLDVRNGAPPLAKRLPNGLTVLLERLPYVHSVSIGVWIRTGSCHEVEEHAGICHFIEHLLFKGTGTRSARQLMAEIESRGGHLNAFTSREYTCLYVRTLDRHMDNAVEILGGIIRDSQFHDLEKERNVILEEIASIEDVPEEYAHDLLVERLWPNHAMGRPITGTHKTMSHIGLEDVRKYFHDWYLPENIIVSAVGNLDPDEAFACIEREFASLKPGDTQDPVMVPAYGQGIATTTRDIGQAHVCLGFPGPTVRDPKRYTYDVMSTALGGGSTSRLFERIREQEGLAYSIYSFHSCFLASGMFGVYAGVAPENLERTVDLAFGELRGLRDAPISDEELELSREQLKGGMLMALESTFNRMSRMARSWMYYDRIVPVQEAVDAVDAVKAQNVRELASDLLRTENCTMVVLGPPTIHPIEVVAL